MTLEQASNLAVLTFVVACMVAAGLGLTVSAIAVPLQRRRLVFASLIANFAVAPALAWGLTKMFAMNAQYETGLLLLGGAAGAPFLPKLAEAARGDVAFSVGLMLILMVGSVVFMPLVLPLMIPGLSAEPWPILKPLLFTMLLPLAAGMLLRSRSESLARRLRPAVAAISNISGLLTLVLLLGRNFSAMLGTFGSGATAVASLFITLAFGAGYLLGGPEAGTRSVLGLGTGQRNVAAALLIATQNFTDPGPVVMILVATVAGLVLLLLAARLMRTQPSIQPGVV
jgi:BASS family bile acid:Na+ symporter